METVLNTAKSMPQNLGKIKEMMGMVRSAGNPMAMVNQMAAQNPQMKQMVDLVNQNGGNAEQVFYAACKQRGVDPQTILNMLK